MPHYSQHPDPNNIKIVVRDCNPQLDGSVNNVDMHACLPPTHSAQVGDTMHILSGSHAGKKGFIKHILANTGCVETVHILNQTSSLTSLLSPLSYDPHTCPACCEIYGWMPDNPPTVSSLHFQTPQGRCTTDCPSPVAGPHGGILEIPEQELLTTTPAISTPVISIPVISNFNLDLSDIGAAQESRSFSILGDNDAKFKLEIKNEDNYYYNFKTQKFRPRENDVDSYRLEGTIEDSVYRGSIQFPAITDDDQYDIYLFAEGNTKHADYVESRFADGSIDINNSIGSQSLLIQKVIYQYTDIALTLSTFSPNSTVATESQSNASITISRGKSKGSTPFSVKCSALPSESYKISNQPTVDDLLSYVNITVGSAPENLPGENVYPTLTTPMATVNGDFTDGTSDKIVIDGYGTNPFPLVGDRVYAGEAQNKTVNGVVTSGVRVVMDDNVDTIMAVGDRVVSNAGGHALDSKHVTVAALNPDGTNVKEFSMSEAVALADGLGLNFESASNFTLTTVTAVNPDGNNANEIQLSGNRGLYDNQSIAFSNAKNFQWPVSDISKIKLGDRVLTGTNVTSESIISEYLDVQEIEADTTKEVIQRILKNKANAFDTKGQKPTVTNGEITTQPGNVVFNKQQSYAFGGDVVKIGSYGESGVLSAYGYDVKLTNLKLVLNSITTTTTAAVSNSKTVPVASVNGVLPSVSTVGGIGINPEVADPIVESRSVTSGSGNLVLSEAQTLENGATLNINNSGTTATITGNIEIVKAGTSSQTVYFDVERLLSTA